MTEKQDKAKGLSPFLVDTANACSSKLLNISLNLGSSTEAAFHGLSQTVFMSHLHRRRFYIHLLIIRTRGSEPSWDTVLSACRPEL